MFVNSDLPANPDRRTRGSVKAVCRDSSGIAGTMDVEDTFGHLTITTCEDQTFVKLFRKSVSINLHL